MAHGNAGCVLSAILLPFDDKDPVGASTATEPANSLSMDDILVFSELRTIQFIFHPNIMASAELNEALTEVRARSRLVPRRPRQRPVLFSARSANVDRESALNQCR